MMRFLKFLSVNSRNIQQPTSNAQHPRVAGAAAHWMFDVQSWMLGVLLFSLTCSAHSASLNTHSFSDNWRFLRADEPQAAAPAFDDSNWETVALPHTARVEALVAGKDSPQWQGLCWYRKNFTLPAAAANKLVWLEFEGAMNVAEFHVNGQSAGKFMGGYLPCVLDVSAFIKPGADNVVAVRLDNRDNPITGPKPLADLDFNLYGGLYRPAQFIIKDKLHITHPLLVNRVAGGGVFVTFSEVSRDTATIKVQTHLRNADARARKFTLKTTLLDVTGQTVATRESGAEELPAATDRDFVYELRVTKPSLWSPNSPYLYRVRTELLADDKVIDAEETRVGIRHIEITADGFRINGEKMFLRGCNRHQEYPYIGNALSDAAQYRDARKIKEAGFDYIRLSHYPQSPAFLDACDELGLVVMNCLMGWQYFGKDPAFAELKYGECRQLIRRDRNHPCVILWEVSLNESDMPKAFIAKTHAIAHEEFPGNQMFTCGWTKGYDVFIQARQHGGCTKVKDVPCVVSEYGDWEYFAQNAGLEQGKWKDLKPAERSSRQLRGDGEVRLLQQALNFQEAHNDNRKTRAFADGIWVMFDYNRGYAPDLEASGVMDIFRLPKFGYWFFRSQRDATELVAGQPVGPVVFIANYWTPDSPREVRVFSNCEEIALLVNGKLIARQHPDVSRLTTHLKHAPFTFTLDQFEPGTLRAVGYRGGKEVAAFERRTPGKPSRLALRFDLSGRPFAASGRDIIFSHVDLLDDAQTIVPTGNVPVFFGCDAPARLIGQNPLPAEAGTATILLESARGDVDVYAISLVPDGEFVRILSAASTPNGRAPAEVSIRYTTDGSEPTAHSPAYQAPVRRHPQLRAALVQNGKVIARADTRAILTATSSESAKTLAKQSPN
jgi:beta-galactosidase